MYKSASSVNEILNMSLFLGVGSDLPIGQWPSNMAANVGAPPA